MENTVPKKEEVPDFIEEIPGKSKIVPAIIIILALTILFASGFLLISIYLGESLISSSQPSEVLNQTRAKFNLTPLDFQSFEDYYDYFHSGDSSSQPQSFEGFGKPRLEYDYNFYEYNSNYYERCQTKRININFSEEKISKFSFNYKNTSFTYEISVYEDLYLFSERLKTQDCYFKSGKYTRGYLSEPYNNFFTDSIARDFLKLRNDFSDDEIVEIASLFVQSIPYGTDKSNLNRFAYETIFEQEGNCLDKSVILVEILEKLGYKTFIILGDSTEYHALVGIVCKGGGNLKINEEKVCFIETTTFAPIGTDIEIEVDKVVDTSHGPKVYKGENYGPDLVQKILEENYIIEVSNSNLDIYKINMDEIEKEMCTTDCVICVDGVFDAEKSRNEITSCDDANYYNRLVEEYNNVVQSYNDVIKTWYKSYYNIEKSMFDNIQLISRNKNGA